MVYSVSAPVRRSSDRAAVKSSPRQSSRRPSSYQLQIPCLLRRRKRSTPRMRSHRSWTTRQQNGRRLPSRLGSRFSANRGDRHCRDCQRMVAVGDVRSSACGWSGSSVLEEAPVIPIYAGPVHEEEQPVAPLDELPALELAPEPSEAFVAAGDPLRDVVVAHPPLDIETAAQAVNVEDSISHMGHEGPEPTPQFVPPPVSEMPMEFTPELRGHDQSGAGFADQAPASFNTPVLDAPEPVMHAQASSFEPATPARRFRVDRRCGAAVCGSADVAIDGSRRERGRSVHAVGRRGSDADAARRRRTRCFHCLRRRPVEADDSHRRRDRAARKRADVDRCGCRSPGDGAGAAAASRGPVERPGGVAVRRPRDRARALHDVPRSSRPRRSLPDVPAARHLRRSARADARSSGALPAVGRARARRRRARQRQVDAPQRVRGSHQPDAQRPCHYHRVADWLRAREPALVHQPARVAR